MLKRLSLMSAAFLFIAFSNVQAAGLEAAVGGWRQSLSGTLSYSESQIADTIDLENDIHFDDESRIFGRAKIDMPLFLPNLYLMATPMEFEGNGTKSGTLQFGNDTFDFSAGLTSKITLNQYDVGLYYGLPFVRTASLGNLNVDVGLNVRIVDLEAKVRGTSTATGQIVQESKSVTLPVPMLYVGVQFTPFDALAFEAEGRGIALGDNKLYSVIGRVRYNFAGPVFLAGGYRFDKLEIDEDDVVADADFRGPFIEMGIKF